MAYFEGVGGSGGSIVVTCDSEFAGSTISCSDGTNTMTAVCPSVSPYEVEFMVSDSGTYEISATVSGTTYTTEVVVDLELEAALEYGFSWPRWVTYGGLDPSDYEDLSDVFSDEAAVRRLMTIHASADYLIDCVTNKLNDIDAFCANDTAMKWIGLRDYVCDGLTAITGVEAKFLASQYWERYLKDHVPTMTSNTAPYGTASATSVYTSSSAYYAFDGNDNTVWRANATSGSLTYEFKNPICVKKLSFKAEKSEGNTRIKNYSILASNDNFATSVTLYTGISEDTENIQSVDLNNDEYYLQYRLTVNDTYNVAYYVGIRSIQFYGRSLDVSVPVMTSNTAPYGEASGSSAATNSPIYKAFDKDTNTAWGSTTTLGWIQYQFINKIVPKMVGIGTLSSGSGRQALKGTVQAIVNGTSIDLKEFSVAETAGQIAYIDIENDQDVEYDTLQLNITQSNIVNGNVTVNTFQIYGVDYSEREFEQGTTKKWLYDHGVELENIEINDNTTKEDDHISIKATTSTYYGMIVPNNSIDLTDYSMERVKIGDVMSGNVQIQASTEKTSYNSGRIGYKTFNVAASDLPNNLYYDISAVNQSAYPNIVAELTNNNIDVSEWWLE